LPLHVAREALAQHLGRRLGLKPSPQLFPVEVSQIEVRKARFRAMGGEGPRQCVVKTVRNFCTGHSPNSTHQRPQIDQQFGAGMMLIGSADGMMQITRTKTEQMGRLISPP
jgi:hypothetical protein